MDRNLSDRIFDKVNFIFLTICLITVLYPCLFIISSSFSSPTAVIQGRVSLWPVGFNFTAYEVVFKNAQVWIGYKNSIIYTVLGTALNLIITPMAAYPLSRKDYPYRNYIMGLFALTMYFGGGLIPFYLLMKNIHFINHIWVMFIPGAMSVYNVILMRTYFQNTIPESLNEAAQLDGCGDIRYLVSIVVPLSKPIFAVIGLFCAVSFWNSYFMSLIYLSSPKLYPLQLVLRNILMMNEFNSNLLSRFKDPSAAEHLQALQNLMKYALIIVASVPVLAVYPFVQKYFVKGIMIGSIKG